MDAQKLQLKIFVTPASAGAVELEAFIPVFHRWIQKQSVEGMLVGVGPEFFF